MLALAFMSTAALAQTTPPTVKPNPNGALSSTPLPLDENNKPIEGICRVGLKVDKNGNPKKPRTIVCTDPRLGDYAVAAAAKKQFVPAMKNGKPVSVKTTLGIDIIDHSRMPDVQIKAQLPVETDPRKTILPGGSVSTPVLIYGPEAKFPASAKGKGKGIDAKVDIRVLVNKLGGIDHASVAKSGGTDFDQHALDTVKTYLFKPALQDGKPVAVYVTIQFTFERY
jgi:TonB family protein